MAAADTSKIRTKLSNLSFTLDNLESLIEPLLAQSLPETLLDLEPLQQAKLQTVLPYVVYDLVFSYLKLEGIDPKTHPVIGELDRIRQYFDKVSNTENPPARKAAIDKEAAGRFIKHAISSVKWTKTAAEEAQEEEGPSASKVPVKITSKMLERQKYEAELMKQDAEDDSEEDTLEVFDEPSKSGNMDMEVDEPKQDAQGASKRRRPAIDPFSGYGDDLNDASKDKDTPVTSTTPPSTTPIPTPTSSKKKKRKSIGPDTPEPSASGSKKKKKASS